MNSIKKNYIYNAIYEILVIVIPLITSPYISRVLGAEGIGVYTYQFTIVSYFLLFARLGIQNYGTRSIASAKDEEEKGKVFINTITLQAILAVIVIVAYLFFVFLFGDKQRKTLAIIMATYLISSVFDINWFFFGLEEFKIPVIRNIILKLLSTICIFVFIQNENDLFKYAIILAMCNLVGQIAIWPKIKGRVKIRKPDFKCMKIILVSISILFVPQIAVSLYKMMDKIMVGAMCYKTELAYYEYASMIVGLPLGFITSLGTVMLPRTSALLKDGKSEKSLEYMRLSMLFSVGLSLAFAFGISGVAPKFIPLYFGKEFAPTSQLLIGLSTTLVFISWANVVRTQYLIPKKMDKEYIISLFCGAAVNILINFILIPYFKAWGAVIGTIVAEITVCFVQTYIVRKSIPLSKLLKENLVFILIGLVMYIVVNGIAKLDISSDLLTVVLQVLFGAIVYISISYVYVSKILKININHISDQKYK